MSKKVHAMLEYIKVNDLFDLDVADMRYMSGYEVLYHLGLEGVFEGNEEHLFMEGVRTLAEANQTKEMTRVSFGF